MGWLSEHPDRVKRRRERAEGEDPWWSGMLGGEGAAPWPWTTLGLTGLVLVIGIGGWLGRDLMLTRLAGPEPAPLEASDIVLADAPSWTPQVVHAAIRSTVRAHTDRRPVDGEGLRAAAEALRRDPWVRQLHQIRRTPQGTVLVRAELREPAALVSTHHGYILIDREGVRLPLTYQDRHLPHLDLPIVRGVMADPPVIGERWPGLRVQAALEMMQTLETEAWANRLTVIDVATHDRLGRPEVWLELAGVWVKWGLAPGVAKGLEPPADIKLDALRHVSQPGFRLAPGFDMVMVHTGQLLGGRRDSTHRGG